MSFEDGGLITRLVKKEGDSVAKGEFLGNIDGENYKLGVDQANANASQANAGFEATISQSVYEGGATGLIIAKNDLALAKQSYSLAKEGATIETKNRAKADYFDHQEMI